MLFHSSFSKLAAPLDSGFRVTDFARSPDSLALLLASLGKQNAFPHIQPQRIPWGGLRLFCTHPTTYVEDLSQTTDPSHASGLLTGPVLVLLRWPYPFSWPCRSYTLAQPWLMVYITSVNAIHPVMTIWNTVLTRILELSLTLVEKNSLDLISSLPRAWEEEGQHACEGFASSAPAFRACFPGLTSTVLFCFV